MTREELIESVYYVGDAYRFLCDYNCGYEDWFMEDSDFDRWAYDRMSECNWNDARDFLNRLPDEYSTGFYLRSDEYDDSSWEFYRRDDESPDWLIEYCVDYAEDDGLFDDETESESESNSDSTVDTLADPPKPEDTITIEMFECLFEEVAS